MDPASSTRKRKEVVMGDLALVMMNSDSKDGANAALELAKKLDHDGWFELIDY